MGKNNVEAIASCKNFIAATIQTRDGILAPLDIKLEDVYPWGAGGAMSKAERDRLMFQKELWGVFYKHWHGEVFSRERCPKNMAIIGTSGEADQVQFVLNKYPRAKVEIIEIDPKKVRMAENTLRQTHGAALESNRVTLVNADATKYLHTQPGRYDYVGADKVFIHLRSKQEEGEGLAPRQLLYQAVGIALEKGGIFHLSDVFANSWRVCAASGFEENSDTRKALEVLEKQLMPAILFASWPARGAALWESIEDMVADPTRTDPNLKPVAAMIRSYEAPYTDADEDEGMVSQIIAITPALGIEARRRRQPDDLVLNKRTDMMWKIAEQFIESIHTSGVRIALPHHPHVAYVNE